MLEYWAGNTVCEGGINFLNFTFCFILLPKASCEEMRVAGELEGH